MLPSARFVRLRSDALTPGPAVGLAWLTRGGQYCTQREVQALAPPRSFAKR